MPDEYSLNNSIIAIIVEEKNKDKVGGGAPIFFVKDEKELEKISMLLARITLGMVHDLGNRVKIIVKH